ncbi:GntR family transcriptional regulator [Virgibacillus sp. 179-BFC.A HS]|uniref:GntR family transcriptional regulator n=1 Tax=Tigheibacillus jepli TaxID=3035914 RepID=A0ABU5CKX3_9BACI|nr:GntR family transcriptional regulator [Virgibacillus sp. 179-BFC.A HS]MDY0406998.1 GntR family transcriptional regulator [Virgibacillus sp. 179-BFC.A HS]
MKINFNNRDPVYLQVVQHFKEQIAKGMLEPGQEIPSRRELAGNLRINPNTAQRAYKEMEEQKLIYTEGNSPSKITKDESVLAAVKKELVTDAVGTFVASMRSINLSLEEVMDLVKTHYDEAGEGKS